MATPPLSFSEVLEQEYHYLFDTKPSYERVQFDRKQIREIGDLKCRLDLARERPQARSRWRILAEATDLWMATERQKQPEKEIDPLDAIVEGLNSLLARQTLLHELIEAEESPEPEKPPRKTIGVVARIAANLRRLSETSTGRQQRLYTLLHKLFDRPARERFRPNTLVDQIAAPEVWRSLLHIPSARRLIATEDRLRPVIAKDADFVSHLCSESAAIGLLIAKNNKNAERMQTAFRTYPALLSTIADDKELECLLVQGSKGEAVRGILYELFKVRPLPGWWERIRAHGPRFLRRKPWAFRTADQLSLSQNSNQLKEMLGGNAATLASAPSIPDEKLWRFNAVLIETTYGTYLSDGHTMRGLYAAIHKQQTAALCLSGGGIRSATFNLGILQGLADHRMLNRLHYISTVSGGGYIGSWLSSWMRRHHEGPVGVAKDLSRQPSDPLKPEVRPIQYLREYSSYLAPRATAFSLDSWTLIAIYIRNLLLNWTMLIPALAAALMVPRLLEAIICAEMPNASRWFGITAVTSAVIAGAVVGWARPATPLPGRRIGTKLREYALPFWFGPLVISGFAFCVFWACPFNEFYGSPVLLAATFAAGAGIGSSVFAVRRASAETVDISTTQMTRWKRLKRFLTFRAFGHRRWELVFAVLAGAFAGWLLHFLFSRLFPPQSLQYGIRREIYICFGVPLYLSVFFIEATLLVGFTTKWSKDYDREWWARGAAALFVYNSVHALGAFAVAVMPVLLFELPKIVAPIGGLSAIGSWLLSRLTKAAGPKPEKESARAQWLMPLLRVFASLALLFFITLISIGTSRTLEWLNHRAIVEWSIRTASNWKPFDAVSAIIVAPLHTLAESFLPDSSVTVPWRMFGNDPTEKALQYLHVLRETRVATLFIFTFLVLIPVSLIMSWALNVNIYSMHGMYRNRLIRAYLGASRWQRQPDPFTGFDTQDNVEMWKLRPHFIFPASFIDFTSFAAQLAGTEWWKDPAIRCESLTIARPMVTAYNVPEADRRTLEEETRTAVADAVNALMRVRDLENNIDAPPTLDLLQKNRTYLETTFASLRKMRPEAVLSEKKPLKMPEAANLPVAFMDPAAKAEEDIRKVPPLHILNAALNLVGGDNLAWQERKAASFTISPLHSGSRVLAYRDSAEYAERISLGTAMSISGAAVSPNRGTQSSPTFTFLMTLFNARLGWWMGNPAKSKYAKASPRVSILSLLREALGRTNAGHSYVYLSDGGHFDNLGLYEMVLRRCRYIIVCDASADGNYGFGDLANAVRKVRIDLGIPIDPLKTTYVGPQQDERYGRYCAWGHIRYQDVDGGDEKSSMGFLLYIKPCVLADCPPDVHNYAKLHTSFPHETTADQFFSESQFESYRALGRHVIGKICKDTLDKEACVSPNVPLFFANAWDYVFGLTPPIGDAKISQVSDVVKWMQLSLG